MTAQSNESPQKILSGQQLLERIFLNAERNLAKELGNSDRLEKWQEVKFFNPARREWLNAWKLFLGRYDLDSLFGIQAGIQGQQEEIKIFVLAMFRLGPNPEEVLKNQAGVIYAAASEGDVEYFKKIGLAIRSRSHAKGEGFFLSFNILRYWFAGLLWLMNEGAGSNALRAYTGKTFTKGAYRKACARLRLNGYKNRMRAPPVLAFDPKTRSYEYAPKWTRMEPNLSTSVHVT